MENDTHKKPASGGVGMVLSDRKLRELLAEANDMDGQMVIGEVSVKVAVKAMRAALRHRDELDTNHKCECTFLCKFCREKRDELEKGHE